jgi:hypothetical protein
MPPSGCAEDVVAKGRRIGTEALPCRDLIGAVNLRTEFARAGRVERREGRHVVAIDDPER